MQFADKKFFEYEFIESRLIIIGSHTAPITPNQRVYFTQSLLGKRIIAIDINSNTATFQYNGVAVLPIANLKDYMVTLVNDKEEEVIKDFPLSDLHRSETFGKIRSMNHKIDIEKSYVIYTNTAVVLTFQSGILFNFFTVYNERKRIS